MEQEHLTSSFLALRSKLHRSALKLLVNNEDARDALQDTYLKLYRQSNITSIPEARNKLFAVLRNVCIDRIREKRKLTVDPIEDQDVAETPYSDDDVERLEDLLTKGLTDLQRRIFSLITHDGLEYEAVAEKLGMTVEAVRMNMSRLRKKVKESYKRLDR